MARTLFCLTRSAVFGDFHEWFDLLSAMPEGETSEIYVWDFGESEPDEEGQTIFEAVGEGHDIIYFSHAFLFALSMPFIKTARTVIICRGYESFGSGETYEQSMLDSPSLAKVLNVPMAVVAGSHSVQQLIEERSGRTSYYLPHGIDLSAYRPLNMETSTREAAPLMSEAGAADVSVRRIMLADNSSAPVRGLKTALGAIESLSNEFNFHVVLTGKERLEPDLSGFSYPIETHYSLTDEAMARLYNSCDLFLSASWYEGFGTAKLAAMACGTPVVCTRDYGVSDFGVDGVNVLLANADDEAALAHQIKRLLTDSVLHSKLKENGLKTAAQFDKQNSVKAFRELHAQLTSLPPEERVFTGDVSASLARELEADGLFDPEYLSTQVSELNRKCGRVFWRLSQSKLSIDEGITQLTSIAALTEPFINDSLSANQRYIRSFKSIHGFCSRVIALPRDDEFFNRLEAAHIEFQNEFHGRLGITMAVTD